MVCASTEGATRIAGGFVLLPVGSLMAAWRACRARPLGIGDMRTWLACREMVARRSAGTRHALTDQMSMEAGQNRTPSYTFAELARLLGVTEKRARASVRRLATAGLIEWSDSAIVFPGDVLGDGEWIDSIGRGRGSVAIPRRILRFLAAGARSAVIATTFGILLRCLSRRRSGWDGRGRVKASFVATVFGVSIPAVKSARRQLVELGWVSPDEASQWSMNRFGRVFRIDLDWTAPRLDRGASSIPPPANPGASLIPPDLQTRTSSGRDKHQDPASNGLAGVQVSGTMEECKQASNPLDRKDLPVANTPSDSGITTEVPRSESRGGSQALPCRLDEKGMTSSETLGDPQRTAGGEVESTPIRGGGSTRPVGPLSGQSLPAPALGDVRIEDLKDTGRLLELYRQAVARGLVGTSENDRLKFVTAAEHALAIGKENPSGLFAYLIRGSLWRYLTQADEDAARRRLRLHDFGPARVPSPPTTGPWTSTRRGEPGLSDDARLVREIRAAMIRAGFFTDPWPAFQARNPGWDRGRWDAALTELGYR